MDRQGLRAGGGCQRPVAAVVRVRLPAIRKPNQTSKNMNANATSEPLDQEVQTRYSERRGLAYLPEDMLGHYVAAPLKRTWQQELFDDETGEVIFVDRSELIAAAGTKIDDDLLTRIQFHLQAGDITCVEVTNQLRLGEERAAYGLIPWSVTALIGKKRRKLLLYADSARMALDVAKDWIELNCSGTFHIVGLKMFDHCVFIKEPQKEVDPNESAEEQDGEAPEFYKVEVALRYRDTGTTRNDTFVLLTKDVDTAATAIHDWIVHDVRNNPDLDDAQKAVALDFDLTVISGVTIPCYGFIEREFSEVYFAQNKPE